MSISVQQVLDYDAELDLLDHVVTAAHARLSTVKIHLDARFNAVSQEIDDAKVRTSAATDSFVREIEALAAEVTRADMELYSASHIMNEAIRDAIAAEHSLDEARNTAIQTHRPAFQHLGEQIQGLQTQVEHAFAQAHMTAVSLIARLESATKDAQDHEETSAHAIAAVCEHFTAGIHAMAVALSELTIQLTHEQVEHSAELYEHGQRALDRLAVATHQLISALEDQIGEIGHAIATMQQLGDTLGGSVQQAVGKVLKLIDDIMAVVDAIKPIVEAIKALE